MTFGAVGHLFGRSWDAQECLAGCTGLADLALIVVPAIIASTLARREREP